MEPEEDKGLTQDQKDRRRIMADRAIHPGNSQVARIGCYGWITRVGGWLMILAIGLSLIAESQKFRNSDTHEQSPTVERVFSP